MHNVTQERVDAKNDDFDDLIVCKNTHCSEVLIIMGSKV